MPILIGQTDVTTASVSIDKDANTLNVESCSWKSKDVQVLISIHEEEAIQKELRRAARY